MLPRSLVLVLPPSEPPDTQRQQASAQRVEEFDAEVSGLRDRNADCSQQHRPATPPWSNIPVDAGHARCDQRNEVSDIVKHIGNEPGRHEIGEQTCVYALFRST